MSRYPLSRQRILRTHIRGGLVSTAALAGRCAIELLCLDRLTEVLIQVAQLRQCRPRGHFLVSPSLIFYALGDSASSLALSRVLAHSTWQKPLLPGSVWALQRMASLPGPGRQLWAPVGLPLSGSPQTPQAGSSSREESRQPSLGVCVKTLVYGRESHCFVRGLGECDS